MKRALLLAALAAMPISALSVKANTSPTGSTDPNMSGETTRMFIINATTPGALTFSGAGTATFNNSVGTSNQFVVGSSTNLGVNSSISATPEFDASATGLMQLSGTSTLMQTNGTAASAANTQAASQSAHDVASGQAHTQAMSQSAGWASGWESQGKWGNNNEWTWNHESTHSAKHEYQQDYANAYNQSFSQVLTASTSSQSADVKEGMISGKFETVTTTSSNLAQSSSMADIAAGASASATAVHGEKGATNAAAWEAEYRVAYAAGLQSATASVNSTSNSDVQVQGLGAIATVNAGETSRFEVNLERLSSYQLLETQQNSTATANGSAAASLSTNSFATQNNNQTASAFMQAFAAAPVPNRVELNAAGDGGQVFNQTLLGSFGANGVIINTGDED